MKIVFVVSSLSSGGAERVASTLCNAWADRGDEVTLIPTFSGGGKPFYPLDSRINLIYLANVVSGNGKTLSGYMSRFCALRNIIIERKPDVVISFLANVNVAAILATRGVKIPLIISERTDPTVIPITKTLSFAAKILYRFADILVVQTPDVAAKVSSVFPGLKKIKSIGNPAPDELFLWSTNESAAGRKILLSLGRISDEKQVHLIVGAFLKIQSEFQDWDLHIYGDGPEKATLEKMIQESGAENRILLKGNTAEPWRVMSHANAFVMASKFEGFPNALMEAMAIGLPCVSFDCPSGPREISANGKYALLVSAGNTEGLAMALRKLLHSEQLRRDLGLKARESIAARYRLSTVLAEWDDMFRDLGSI